MLHIPRARRETYRRVCQGLAVASAIAALVYLKWLFVDARPDNRVLFGMLVAAEVFSIAQAAGFWFTISFQRWTRETPLDLPLYDESIDIFVTVAGEPLEIVEKTVLGALSIRHPRKRVWVLDDGRSRELEVFASLEGAGYLTRPDRRGAKAGNINEALKRTNGDFVVIFDADHVPHPDFLEETMGEFINHRVAFVQTPQNYVNRFTNRVAAGAHDQQRLFYGPIMRGRDASSSAFSCGTNVVFRRAALDDIGGMPEDSITEDLRVSLLLLERGWTSRYVSVILADGLGPLDVGGYFSQQFRWARGGLEILFRRKPFFRRMRVATRIQFGLSFLYWFTGLAYSVYLVLPIAYLVFGARPVHAPNQYPIYFLPYITVTLLTMAYASDFRLTFAGIWFTLGSFPVHISALLSAIVGRAVGFVVTAKTGARRSLRPVWVHVVVISALVFAIVYGLVVRGFTPAVANNVAFAIGHILILQGFVRYALKPERAIETAAEDDIGDSEGIDDAEAIVASQPV